MSQSTSRKTSVEVRRQSVAKAAVASPELVHVSNYRRRRRVKIGGPVVRLDEGIIRQRGYTNVTSVVSFVIYAGIMARHCLQGLPFVWEFWKNRKRRWNGKEATEMHSWKSVCKKSFKMSGESLYDEK